MKLAEMTWPEIKALDKNTPVVIPVAALEQHGHHLPLFTDSLLLGEVVNRVEPRLQNRVLFTPLMWLGNSQHHLDFAGTLTASPRVYLDLLNDLVENLLHHGFKRIVFLNGHGGNSIPGKQAIFELRQRHRERSDLLLLFTTYWEHAQPHETRSDLQQTEMGHACEWETSMIMRIAPQLVKGDVKNCETIRTDFGFEPAYRGWTSQDRTVPGQMGAPQFASVEKGEHLCAAFSEGVTKFLERVVAWQGTWP